MNQQLIVWCSEAILLFFLVVAFLVVIGASVYDIRQASRKKVLAKVSAKLRRVRKPTITVLVYAKNSSDSIAGCLRSIKRNRYSRFDIVVADDSSTDDTRRIVRRFIEKYPLLPLRLYSSRLNRDRCEVNIQGYSRSQKGDLVLIINASNTIPASMLKDCATRFASDEKLNVLEFDIYSAHLDSITMTYYRFLQLSKSLFRKFLSLILIHKVNAINGGTIYRQPAFRNTCRAQIIPGRYDSGLMVADDSANNDMTALSNMLTLGKENRLSYWIIAIAAILLQTYSMYTAATLQSTTLLTIGWFATAVWLLIAVWSSDPLKVSGKIKLTFFAPIIYFLVYAQLVLFVIFTIIKAILMLWEFTYRAISFRFSF